MLLLNLPTDIMLEIFFYLEAGDPIPVASSNSNTSTLATMSLVCKQLHELAYRALLRSLRWADKAKTKLSLDKWLKFHSHEDMLGIPKQLSMACKFDFEGTSSTTFQRSLDVMLHERIYTRILSFSSLSTLVFSDTGIIVQYLYPVLLLLPMLRSLTFVEIEFSQLMHSSDTDGTLFSVMTNYPFTSLRLTHLAIREIFLSDAMEDTYEYHPINLLRVPSLEIVEIMWDPPLTAAYMYHVHPKTGIRRQSGTVGWPNTDIPCTVLEQQQGPITYKSDSRLPLERLTRLIIEPYILNPNVVRALKTFLSDCARHPSYDPPVPPSTTVTPENPLTLTAVPQNTLAITLFVKKCRLSDIMDPTLQGCLAPVVQYEGPLSTSILPLFIEPTSLDHPTTPPPTRVSSFHCTSPTEAENTESQLPKFNEVIEGLQALQPMSATTPINSYLIAPISEHRIATGLQDLTIRVYALDPELLYAIQQLFGRSIEKIVVQYAHHTEDSAKILLTQFPDILWGLPRIRSIILQRIPDPAVVFAHKALERHAAITGDQHWYRRPRAGHHHPGLLHPAFHPPVNPFIANHPNNMNINVVHPNLNANHANANHPHPQWNPAPAQEQNHTHLLTLEQFQKHTATVEDAKRLAATSAPSLFRQATKGGDALSEQVDEEEEAEDMRDSVVGWGWRCKSLWEVQIERYRFVRWFGEIGERWTRAPLLV